MGKRKVLFLCTGNSCRSQMAEAIVNYRLGDTWEAVSAGTKPAGYVHPKAMDGLAEIGIQQRAVPSWPMNFAAWISTWWSRCAIRRLKNVPSGWGKANGCTTAFPIQPRRMT